MADSQKYKAFISYSRKDHDSARRLQRELEAYVLPKAVQIAGHDARKSKRPLNPVFRDESELVPGQDLPERIRQGLAQSEFLIVVCSPDAVRSEWVEKEIVDFTKLGSGKRILAVVVRGEPNAAALGVGAENEALPRALRFHVEADGTISSTPADPLWVDRRESVIDSRQMFLRIVGALLGLQSLDDLILRERQAERRRRLIAQGIAAAMTVLTIFASIAGWIAYEQRGEALIARDRAVQAQMRLLTQAATQRLKDYQVPDAQRIILEVLAQRRANLTDRAAAVNVFQEMRAADIQLAVLSGHTDVVETAAYSPDGKRIVSASDDKTARIWDAVTGTQLAVLTGHGGIVASAAYSPDGKRIVTASIDKTARIWDSRTGAQLAVLSGHSDIVASAAWSPDGKRIVTASYDKTARIWDANSGVQRMVLSGHSDNVSAAAYSPDGRRIVTASNDKTARIWDANTGAQLAVLSGHGNLVNSAAYSPDGRRIVTASYDKTARIWDARTGAQLALLSGHDNFVNSAAWSPDSQRVVTASYDGTARTWNANTGAQLSVLSGHGDFVFCAAYAPDGKHILTSSVDKTVRIWDVSGGAQRAVLSGNGDVLNSAAYSPDGRRIVTASLDKTARIWDITTGAQLMLLSGHSSFVQSAAYSPDGKRIVTASYDKTARIWDASTGAQLTVLSGHSDSVASAAYSPDGKHIVTTSLDKTARVWNAATGAQISVLSGHDEGLDDATYSPDGKRIVTASFDKTARIWDANRGVQLAVLSGHGARVTTASFSHDGARIVTTSFDKTTRIWDSHTGIQLAELSSRSAFGSAAYSPDDRHVVTGSSDTTARIWDAATGTQLAVLSGYRDMVYSTAWSPDGSRIVTASPDKTARIWDARIPADLDGQIIWDKAAEFDDFSDTERSQLGLQPDSRVRTWQNDASTCDQAAAAPYDPDRIAPGIMQDQIAADVANSACGQVNSNSSPMPRLVYQFGRALLAKGDFNSAKREFELALSGGYRATCVDLGKLLVEPPAGLLDPDRAVSLFQRGWLDGVPIAAFELGHLYEYGVAGKGGASRTSLHPDLPKAWLWYRKGADAGEPNALARFGERDDIAASAANSAKKRDAMLLDAFRYYAAAAERAQDEDWPDAAWKNWRYRRATLARLLSREGMMQQIADAYRRVRDK